MKLLEKLKATFEESYLAFEESRREAEEIKEFYHDRQYTAGQLELLRARGQPPESFNLIKAYSHLLIGYFSGVYTNLKVEPKHPDDAVVVAALGDVVNHTEEYNNFPSLSAEIKLEGILTGLLISYTSVQPAIKTGLSQEAEEIIISPIPANEMLLDPKATRPDYSDGRFKHRFKWVDEDTARSTFGNKVIDKLLNTYDDLYTPGMEEDYRYTSGFSGSYRENGSLLIIHSVFKDQNNDFVEVFWSGGTVLKKRNLSEQGLGDPYSVVRISNTNKAEYYSIFKGLLPTQLAMNQAIVQIQLLANSSKVLVEQGAVDNADDFAATWSRVNSVIPVLRLTGIKHIDNRPDIVSLYNIIEKGMDRFNFVLGVNDSFLGSAYSGDSGKKVQMQMEATVKSLRYITTKIALHHKLLGQTVVNTAKALYTTERVLRVTDKNTGRRWLHLNTPMKTEEGQPIMDYEYDSKGQPMLSKDGNPRVVPVTDPNTDFRFTNADITVEITSYENDQEVNRAYLEFMLGAAGQVILEENRQGYVKILKLVAQNMNSKYSIDVGIVLDETSQKMMSQEQQQEQQQQQQQQQGMLNKMGNLARPPQQTKPMGRPPQQTKPKGVPQ